jgi:hypothetical protein
MMSIMMVWCDSPGVEHGISPLFHEVDKIRVTVLSTWFCYQYHVPTMLNVVVVGLVASPAAHHIDCGGSKGVCEMNQDCIKLIST